MPLNRRDFLASAGLLGAGTLLSAGRGRAQTPPRLNFLWLIGEDLGPTALSCYGRQPAALTPRLDALAAEGVRYSRFYTTAPVCSASRSAFMTGCYQTTLGAHHHRSHRADGFRLANGVRPLPHLLNDAGYLTANLGPLPAELGFRGTAKTDWNFTIDGRPFATNAWADLHGDRPFLAQLNFNETHRAFKGPARVDPARVELPPYYPDVPEIRSDYAAYLDSAAELDRKIGAVLDHLERDGLAAHTVVIFMGDNGESHIRGKQFCYEEGLHVPLIIRWPQALQPPAGFRPGTVDDRLLEAIDLAPTILSLAGAPVPPTIQGRPFLGAAAGAPKESVFGARDRCDETAMRIRTVRDARFRYLRNFTPEVPYLAPNAYKAKQYPLWTLLPQLQAAGRLTPEQAAFCAPRMPEEELYDLIADPHQTRNLATDPAHATELARLRGVLERWIVDTDDQGRLPETPEAAAPAPK